MYKDKIVPLQIGQEVSVSFDVESKEYNGRWFTNLRAWKVDTGVQNAQQTTQTPVSTHTAPTAAEGSDLPF